MICPGVLLTRHTGHYFHALVGFPDDLKEALQKMDNLAMEEHRMTAVQTLVVVEQLPPRVGHSERCPLRLSHRGFMINFAVDKNVEDLKKTVQKVQRVQGMPLFPVLLQVGCVETLQSTTHSGNGSPRLIRRVIGMLLWLNGKTGQETGSFILKPSRSGEHLTKSLFSGFMANVRLFWQR